ncbi:hypothetical protein RFI_03722, partial [Reticulomyxa filosa]
RLDINKNEMHAMVSSCLLNLSVHTGSVSQMFDTIGALLQWWQEYEPRERPRLDCKCIMNKLESQVGVWQRYGCPFLPCNVSRSFEHEKSANYQPLFLQNVDTVKDITMSNLACDGTYLYAFHRWFGLFQIGTGCNGTIEGRVYAHNPKFGTHAFQVGMNKLTWSTVDSVHVAKTSKDRSSKSSSANLNSSGSSGNPNVANGLNNPNNNVLTASKDTASTLFYHKGHLYFRHSEMLSHLMVQLDPLTFKPSTIFTVEPNFEREGAANGSIGTWAADIDRLTSNGEYILGQYTPIICYTKDVTRQGICSYCVTGKRSVNQRWYKITLKEDEKHYICAACATYCFPHNQSSEEVSSGDNAEANGSTATVGYKKSIEASLLPKPEQVMFCECGSGQLANITECKCFNAEFLEKSEFYLDQRLTKSKDHELWREGIAIGSHVDCLDKVRKWYTATVIELDGANDRIQVNYDGWSSKYNEWISKSTFSVITPSVATHDFKIFLFKEKEIALQSNVAASTAVSSSSSSSSSATTTTTTTTAAAAQQD